jgi:hypothetical protein
MMRKLTNAVEVIWQARQGFLRLKGDQDINYAKSCILLAYVYCTMQNYATALPMFEEGIQILMNTHGSLDDNTRIVQSNMQRCKAKVSTMVTTPARMKEWSPYHSDQAQCIKCKHYFAVLEGETRCCYSCLQV